MKFTNVFVSSLLVLATTVASAQISPEKFSTAFNDYYLRQIRPASSQVELAHEKTFVFVAGFLNEGMVGYFGENIAYLRLNGVPENQIFVVYPDSRNDVEKNINPLAEKLQAIARKTSKPLTIVAHSKGATEMMGVVLSHPDLDASVDTVYLLQGALKGSSVADYIKGYGVELDDRMPLWARTKFHFSGKSARLLSGVVGVNSGIDSLTHKYFETLWPKLLKSYRDSGSRFADKVYYINGKQAPALISEAMNCTGTYMQTYYGANDGLVLLDDQYLDEVGTRLAVIDADHADLTNPFPVSNAPVQMRYALMAAMVQSLE